MMYGKLIEGEVEFAPNPLKIQDRHVFTSNPEIFEQQGYLPVDFTPAPEVPEGYQLSFKWVLSGKRIVKIWEIKQV